MDNFTKNNEAFEQFIKKSLQNTSTEPDPDTWSRVEERQAPLNKRLRWKKHAKWGLPLAATIAALVCGLLWWRSAPDTHTTTAPSQAPAGQLVAATTNTEAAVQATLESPAPVSVPAKDQPSWIPKNQVPVKNVQFLANNGINYLDPTSGNRVIIPGNILVHADGRPAQGMVDLYFREYRSMADFFASQLPMHYSDERGMFIFNSGGMFEVRVGQNDEELFLAPGQAYEVQFEPTAALTAPNLYAFNDDTRSWGFVPSKDFGGQMVRGGDGIMLPAITDVQQVVADNRYIVQALGCLPSVPVIKKDEPASDWVMDAARTGQRLAHNPKPLPKWMRRKKTLQQVSDNVLPDFDGQIEIVLNRDNHSKFFPQDHSGIFTELSAFKDVYFVRTGDSLENINGQTINIEVALRTQPFWSQIDIQQDNGGADCIITLLGDEEGIGLHARLALASGSNAPQREFDPNVLFANYKRLQKERLANMAKEVRAMRHFIQMWGAFAPESEWCMDSKEWANYFDANRPMMQTRYDSLCKMGLSTNQPLAERWFYEWAGNTRNRQLELATKYAAGVSSMNNLNSTLRIMSFGIFNCDQIYRLSTKLDYVQSEYKTKTGETVYPAELRILDRESLLFMPVASPNRMLALPGRQIDMVLTDRSGRIFYLSNEQYAKIDFRGEAKHTFVMEDITRQATSPKEWAAILQM